MLIHKKISGLILFSFVCSVLSSCSTSSQNNNEPVTPDSNITNITDANASSDIASSSTVTESTEISSDYGVSSTDITTKNTYSTTTLTKSETVLMVTTSTVALPGETADISLHGWVLNVGQSSCTVLESDGECMIVDAADSAHAEYVLSFLNENNINIVDFLILTHYDDDHIGAAAELLNHYSVSQFRGPDYKKKGRKYQEIIDTGKRRIDTYAGQYFSFGKCDIDIIGPEKNLDSDDPNDYSVAMIITDQYNNRLYIGGDSPGDYSNRGEQTQKDRIDEPVDVYVVNHHGAENSSNVSFLYKLKPQFAIISCGKGNQYGHPNKLVLNRLNQYTQKIYRTDERQEDISFSFGSNGVHFYD